MDRTSGSSSYDPYQPAPTGTVRAWTLLDELVIDIHTFSSRFPPEEKDGIGRSMRKAAVSAAVALLAAASEGAAAPPYAIREASRRLAVLRYLIYLARRLNLIDLRRYRLLCLRTERAARGLKDLDRGRADSSGNSPAGRPSP